MTKGKAKQNSKRNLKGLLPFGLGFALLFLAGWLFIPYITAEKATLPAGHINPQEALRLLVADRQPDHVFFSPNAHDRDTCNQCHEFKTEEYLALFKIKLEQENAANSTDAFYSAEPISMASCESCHAIPAHLKTTTANTACGTCHK